MTTDRLATLRNLLEQDPTNSFLRYAFAMELLNLGQLEQAIAQFEQLVNHDPNYVATYYHYGKTLEKLGRASQAAKIYRQGIQVASQIGNHHAKSELEAALEQLNAE